MVSFMVPAAGGTAAVLAGVLVAGSGSGLSSDLALTIASCIQNGLACILIGIPLWSFVMPIIQENGVGDRTPYGHVLMLARGAAWGLYAVITWNESRVSTFINAACFVFQFIYVLVFICYAEGINRWTAAALLLAALIGCGVLAWVVVVKVIQRGELDKSVIATVASVVSCITYAAVGWDIAVVARSKDVSNMDPLAEVLFNILSAGASVYYAYLSDPVDNYIGVPNVVGVVFLLVQLVVFVRHCKAKLEDEEEAIVPAATEEETSQTVEEETNNATTSSPDYGTDMVAMFASPTSSPDYGTDMVAMFASPTSSPDYGTDMVAMFASP